MPDGDSVIWHGAERSRVIQRHHPAAGCPSPMSIRSYCILLVFSGCVCGSAIAFPSFPKFDRYGDPLPTGATARLGTSRLRAGCDSLHFLADGKSLIGVATDLLRLWDANDGRLLGTQAGEADRRYTSRRRTAVCSRSLPRLTWNFTDLPSGTRLSSRFRRPDSTGIRRIAVNDDRSMVAHDHISVAVNSRRPFGSALSSSNSVERIQIRDTSYRYKPSTRGRRGGHYVAWVFIRRQTCRYFGPRGTRVWDVGFGQATLGSRQLLSEAMSFHRRRQACHRRAIGGQDEWMVCEQILVSPPGVAPADGWLCPSSFAVSSDENLLLVPTDNTTSSGTLKPGHTPSVVGPVPGSWGRGIFAPDGKVRRHLRHHSASMGSCDRQEHLRRRCRVGHVAAVGRVLFTHDGNRLVSIGDDQTTAFGM